MKSFLFFFFFCVPASAWEDHSAVTRLALSSLSDLDKKVSVEPLASFLADAGFSDVKDFLRRLELNPNTKLTSRAGETPGGDISLRRILEAYADEPDGGMDQDLFGHYPGLWKDDYAYMGGLLPGTPSQAFRHMFWPQGFLKAPAKPGESPVFEARPLGQAPERSLLFAGLSQSAFRLGHPYWGARFLAWSLHYIQDVSQPYHAVQLPSLEFIYQRPGAEVDVEVTARLISYYHFAFEMLASQLVSGDDQASRGLQSALRRGQALSENGADQLTRDQAADSARRAPDAGKASLALFPAVTDPERLDPVKTLQDPAWKASQERRRIDQPGAFMDYLSLLTERLGGAGSASRTLVLMAIPASSQLYLSLEKIADNLSR